MFFLVCVRAGGILLDHRQPHHGQCRAPGWLPQGNGPTQPFLCEQGMQTNYFLNAIALRSKTQVTYLHYLTIAILVD